jgi:hypothetical protein
MNILRRWILTTFILIVSSLPAMAQDKPGNPAYDWLNGKWSGQAPGGGGLELDLRVVNDNEITGQSRIPRGGGKREPVKSVSGRVEGDKVHLELYGGKAGTTQKWNFSHKEETLVATRKGEEFIFKKLK